MSAIALSAPIMAFKINGKPVMVWHGSHTVEDKDYYLRFIDGLQDLSDDIRDEMVVEIKQFEYWQKKPDFT